MATSYANYTGGASTTSAIYTVPTGKVAKIIITNIRLYNGHNIYIGNYVRQNNCSSIVRSEYGSHRNNNNALPIIADTEGMMALRRYSSDMTAETTFLKRTHILLAGETIYFSGSSSLNIISFTVIEEDI